MFADSLLDSPWAHRSRRGWTTLASFAVQALAVGGLLALPLIYTEGLPRLVLVAPLLSPAPPPAPLPAPPRTSSAPDSQSNMIGIRLLSPAQIPRGIEMLSESVPPPPVVDPSALGVNHETGPGGKGTVWDSILGPSAVAPPPPVVLVAHSPRVSHMMEGNLIHQVQPVYPPLARQARIQGAVMLRAVISREGTIENLLVLSGHPMLAPAALDAVRQWRYRPYYLNGEPVEVETQVTVNFVLSGG